MRKVQEEAARTGPAAKQSQKHIKEALKQIKISIITGVQTRPRGG